MKSSILGSSYVARSVNAANNRMVNLYPEAIPEGGKEPAFLSRAPGLRRLATIGDGPIRGLWTFGGVGYVVSGDELYSVDSAWNASLLGAVTGNGQASLADNGTQLFIACNGPSYIYNKDTGKLAKISDADFAGAQCVGYLDGYFVYSQPDSQMLWVTSLLDGTQVDPLDFASAEGSPDGLVALAVDHREVWLFGTNSTEVWYDAGGSDFPLQRIQGAFNEVGCAATYSVAKLDNSLFWLGADARGQGIVYRANGYQPQRVSTHAVEWQIQQYGDISDAVAYTYQQDGHAFYVLTFPAANATWVYDASTQAWHERGGWQDGAWTRHRSNCQMAFGGEIVVGDYEDGRIYALDMTTHADDGADQRWLRSWRALPTGQNNLQRTAQHSLQLDCEAGVGLQTPPTAELADAGEVEQIVLATEAGEVITTEAGDELLVDVHYETTQSPSVMLRWSDDGGHSWSSEHWRSMGRIGNYGHRTIWRRLGMTVKLRDRVYEVSGTDPVKIAITGAELILSGTNG